MIIVFWLVLFLSLPTIAKSYYHPSISQTFNFLENGDVEVTDIRYFTFSGSFSWAQLDLLLRGVDDIQFQGVWDVDTGSPLRYEAVSYTHLIIILSVGALADDEFQGRLIEIAREGGKKIRIPSGAVVGLDNLKIGQVSPPKKLLLRTTKDVYKRQVDYQHIRVQCGDLILPGKFKFYS